MATVFLSYLTNTAARPRVSPRVSPRGTLRNRRPGPSLDPWATWTAALPPCFTRPGGGPRGQPRTAALWSCGPGGHRAGQRPLRRAASSPRPGLSGRGSAPKLGSCFAARAQRGASRKRTYSPGGVGHGAAGAPRGPDSPPPGPPRRGGMNGAP